HRSLSRPSTRPSESCSARAGHRVFQQPVRRYIGLIRRTISLANRRASLGENPEAGMLDWRKSDDFIVTNAVRVAVRKLDLELCLVRLTGPKAVFEVRTPQGDAL